MAHDAKDTTAALPPITDRYARERAFIDGAAKLIKNTAIAVITAGILWLAKNTWDTQERLVKLEEHQQFLIAQISELKAMIQHQGARP